jgi:hypothetical protein
MACGDLVMMRSSNAPLRIGADDSNQFLPWQKPILSWRQSI